MLAAGKANSSAGVLPDETVAEDFGYDVHEGKTNKITKVYAVTPTHVQVLHEGGKSGRKIPRHSLPPELAARYPYDAKAAEYQQQQMDIAARQMAAQRAVMEESVFRREMELIGKIAKLRKRAAHLDGEIRLEKKRPGRRPKARRNSYGAWLHHLRKEAGLTQAAAARLTGIPRTTLTTWERTGDMPGRKEIFQWARTYRVSIQRLLRTEKPGVD